MDSYFFHYYSYQLDPEAVRVLSCLPSNILGDLPEDELLDLEKAIVSYDGHNIDFRQIIPSLPKRFDVMLQDSLDRRIEISPEPISSNQKFHWTTQTRSIATTLGASILLLGCTIIYPLIQRQSTLSSEVVSGAHATILPWIEREADCQGAKQTWKDGFCFDSEHSPEF